MLDHVVHVYICTNTISRVIKDESNLVDCKIGVYN